MRFFKYLNSWKYSHLQSRGHNSLVLTFLKREVLTSCLLESTVFKSCFALPVRWLGPRQTEAHKKQHASHTCWWIPPADLSSQAQGTLVTWATLGPTTDPLTQKVWNHWFRIYQVPTIGQGFLHPSPWPWGCFYAERTMILSLFSSSLVQKGRYEIHTICLIQAM